VKGMAEGLERSGSPLSTLIANAPAELKANLKLIESLWSAASVLAVSAQPAHERLVAIEVLARGRPDVVEDVIPALLAPTQPVEIQLGAARAVATSRRLSLASRVLSGCSTLALGTRRELLAGLTGKPSLAPALVDALEKQLIAPSELDAPARAMLEHLADAKLRERVVKILARFAPPQRSEALARYQAALKLAGNAQRGT